MLTSKKLYGAVVAWVCGALFYCYQFALRVSPAAMTTELKEAFQVEFCTVGLISAFYYYAYTLFQVPAGILLDKYGPRRVLLVAVLICGGGALCFAMSHTAGLAALGRFVMGVGSAFSFLGCVKIATVRFPKEKLSFFIGCTIFIGCLGAVVGTGPFSWALGNFGWRGIMEGLALGAPLLCLFFFFFLKDGSGSLPAVGLPSPPPAPVEPIWKGLCVLLKNPQCWLLGAYGFLMYATLSVWADLWGVSFLVAQYNLDPVRASHLASFLYIGMGVCAPAVYGVLKIFKGYRRCMLFSAVACTVLSSLICFVPFPAPEMVAVLLFVMGGMITGQFLAFSVVCDLNPPHLSATASAVQNMACMLSGVLLQPAVGWILDWTTQEGVPSYPLALSVVPVCTFMAAFCVLFIQETYRSSEQGA
jgi:MFS family permease